VRLGERSDLLIEGGVIGRVYRRRHDPNNGDNHIVAYIDPVSPAENWTVTLEARHVNSGRSSPGLSATTHSGAAMPAHPPPISTTGPLGTLRQTAAPSRKVSIRRLGVHLLRVLRTVDNPDDGSADSCEVVFLCIDSARNEFPLLAALSVAWRTIRSVL
jgi:hypothetical protein